jgi:hypothetical protein
MPTTQVTAMAVCSGLAVIFSLAGMIDHGVYTLSDEDALQHVGIWTWKVSVNGVSVSASINCEEYYTAACGYTACCQGSKQRCKANKVLSIIGFLPGFAAFLLGGLALRGRNPGVMATFANIFAGFCYFCIWTIAIGMVEGPLNLQSRICGSETGARLGAAFGCVLVASFFFVAAGILNVISSKSAGYETAPLLR